MSAGLSFGKAGSGFARLNFALDSAKMSEVIARLEIALKGMDIGQHKLGGI